MAKKYEDNLRRLTTVLSDHIGRYGYPRYWPETLSDYELVVETCVKINTCFCNHTFYRNFII